MLYIAYDKIKDKELMAKLESDLTWFDAPVSIQPGTLQDTGSILKFQMKSSEVAINAYIGLKLKYLGLEIDKTGILYVQIWEIFLTFQFRSSGGHQVRGGGSSDD